MKNLIIYITLIITLFLSSLSPAQTAPSRSETDFFKRIQRIARSHKSSSLKKISQKFFRKYPKSTYIPDIRLILAESEELPEQAISKYTVLIKKYRYYKKMDYVLYKICQLLYLTAQWKQLKSESIHGIKSFPDSIYSIDFRFFLALSYLSLNRLDDSMRICNKIKKYFPDRKHRARANIIIAHINKKTLGLSREYIKNISALVTHSKTSETMPTALFLLGRYYEKKGDHNRSYSAYRDIIKQYPRSPESNFSRKRIWKLKKYKPTIVDYMPDENLIKKSETIDIKPEYVEKRENRKGTRFYSVSFGPFYNLKKAMEIKKLILNDYKPIRIIKLRRKFVIYAGMTDSMNRALSMKVRFAEEYGLNGTIVTVIKKSNKQYIYGE